MMHSILLSIFHCKIVIILRLGVSVKLTLRPISYAEFSILHILTLPRVDRFDSVFIIFAPLLPFKKHGEEYVARTGRCFFAHGGLVPVAESVYIIYETLHRRLPSGLRPSGWSFTDTPRPHVITITVRLIETITFITSWTLLSKMD